VKTTVACRERFTTSCVDVGPRVVTGQVEILTLLPHPSVVDLNQVQSLGMGNGLK
jgi:hypothetical protein